MFLMLTAALWAAYRLMPKPVKASSLRLLDRHVGALEHGLRCLLLQMRGAAQVAAKVPKGLPRSAAARRIPCKPPRFSLSLAALARGFVWNGRCISALARPRKPAPARRAQPLKIPPAAPAPVADPAEQLRALKAFIPDAVFWHLTTHRPARHSHALPVPAANTS